MSLCSRQGRMLGGDPFGLNAFGDMASTFVSSDSASSNGLNSRDKPKVVVDFISSVCFMMNKLLLDFQNVVDEIKCGRGCGSVS